MSDNMRGLDTFDIGYAAAEAKYKVLLTAEREARERAEAALNESIQHREFWRKEAFKIEQRAEKAEKTAKLRARAGLAWKQRAESAEQRILESAKCKSCGGNDGDAPCAYPGEHMHGCLRDARMCKELEKEKDK